MLRVHGTFHHSDPEMGIYLTFKVPPELMASRNFGLLGVCMMSRQVYLKLYPNFLPGGSKSKIYYNAKDTVVFIENFADVVFNPWFAEGIIEHYRRQAWFTNIQNLGVPFHLFKVGMSRSIRAPWRGHVPLLHAIRPFKNLERLIGVVWKTPQLLMASMLQLSGTHWKSAIGTIRHGRLLKWRLCTHKWFGFASLLHFYCCHKAFV